METNNQTDKTNNTDVGNKPIMGVVANCKNLNVRKQASVDAAVVTIIGAGTEVLVDKAKSTDAFYSIQINSEIKGYCMKKFIKIQ